MNFSSMDRTATPFPMLSVTWPRGLSGLTRAVQRRPTLEAAPRNDPTVEVTSDREPFARPAAAGARPPLYSSGVGSTVYNRPALRSAAGQLRNGTRLV